MPAKRKKVSIRTRFRHAAQRRLDALQKADAKVKLAAAKAETARLNAEAKRIEAEGAAERDMIRTQAKRERDAIRRGLSGFAAEFVEPSAPVHPAFVPPPPAPPPTPPAPPPTPHEPPPQFLERTRSGGDGKLTKEYVLGRDGQPIPAVPKTAPAAPQAPPPAPRKPVPRANIPAEFLPVWVREGRQPTRQELADRHNGLRFDVVDIPTPIWVTEKRVPEAVELKQWQREVASIRARQPAYSYEKLSRIGNGTGHSVHESADRGTTLWNRSLKGL